MAKTTKQLTVLALLALVCAGDLSWALAARALSHGPHAVTLSRASEARLVLHHHDDAPEHGPHVAPVDGHHDDHFIGHAPASAEGPRRFSFDDGPSTQALSIQAFDLIERPVAFATVVARPIDRSSPRRTIVLRI